LPRPIQPVPGSEMRAWLKEVSEYAKQVGERFDREEVLSLVAIAHVERKDFKEVVHVAELINDDVPTARGDALWKIADVMGTRRPMTANRCGTTWPGWSRRSSGGCVPANYSRIYCYGPLARTIHE